MNLRDKIIEVQRNHINTNVWADENADRIIDLICQHIEGIENPFEGTGKSYHYEGSNRMRQTILESIR